MKIANILNQRVVSAFFIVLFIMDLFFGCELLKSNNKENVSYMLWVLTAAALLYWFSDKKRFHSAVVLAILIAYYWASRRFY